MRAGSLMALPPRRHLEDLGGFVVPQEHLDELMELFRGYRIVGPIRQIKLPYIPGL